MKLCPDCKIDKDDSEFSKDRHRLDGLCRLCRDCDRARQRDKYARGGEKSREVSRVRFSDWRKNNPGVVEDRAKKKREERAAAKREMKEEEDFLNLALKALNRKHPRSAGEQAARQRQYDHAHRSERTACRMKYDKENPDKARRNRRVSYNNRRSRLAGSPDKHTASEERALFEAQGGLCFYCGHPIGNYGDNPRGWQIEHVIPLSRGGSNEIRNIVMSCPKCNNQKAAKIYPTEWVGPLGVKPLIFG